MGDGERGEGRGGHRERCDEQRRARSGEEVAGAGGAPVCGKDGGSDGDNGTTCAFTSFEQCMMTARGGGGFCVQNPWYLAYGSGQKSPESTGRSNRAKRR